MSVLQFDDFVAILSGNKVVFAESENGPPLWVIDAGLFAGQPSVTVDVSRHGPRETTTTISLSGARYSGTNVSADVAITIIELAQTKDQDFSQDGTIVLAFPNATFGWTFPSANPQELTNPFVEFLKRTAPLSSLVELDGPVVAFGGGGGITFRPATKAAAVFLPGLLSLQDSEADTLCTVEVAGITFGGSTLSLAITDSPLTTIIVRSTESFSVPVPSPTPIGELRAKRGFSVFTANMRETAQSGAFSTDSSAAQYSLQLIEGLADVGGGTVEFDLTTLGIGAGGVVFDLASTTPRVDLIMAGTTSSEVLVAGGVGLRIQDSPDSRLLLGLVMTFDGSAWTVSRASLPLPGLFLPLDDGISEPGPARELATLSLVSNGPNWLKLGPLGAGEPRLHIEDFGVHVVRPADLLDLEINSSNIVFEATDGATPTLRPAQNGQPSFWRVVFPPQHLAEQAFYRGSEQPELAQQSDDGLPLPPVAARMAEPSQLAFFVPDDVPRFDVTLSNLLDWKRFKQAGTRLDTFDVPYDPPEPLNPPDFLRETAIAVPYGLVVSLDQDSGWSHTATTDTGRSELWHTRLAFRKPLGNGNFVVDERPSSSLRQGRAYWSPDFESPRPDPFKTSLKATDRQQIVVLTSGTDNFARTFDVEELMFSAYGATVHISAAWSPPPNQLLDLTLWQHVASYGRDQFVRVGRRGFVFPFGHRATLVTVSERRFLPPTSDGDQGAAYLVQFDYVMITQPVRAYAALDFPFHDLEFVTRITPVLSKPDSFPGTDAFWIETGDQPFLFDVQATHCRGERVRFRVPVIFVEGNPDFDRSVDAAGVQYRQNRSINAPVDLGRQKVAFAPSDKREDTTFEVATVSLDFADLRPGGQESWMDDQGAPLFRPTLTEASIHHVAAAALADGPETARVGYFPGYLSQPRVQAGTAPTSGVDVFLEFLDTPDAAIGADKTGIAAPAYPMTAISRTLGAVGGRPDDILAGTIDPRDFLGNNATFLGDISLASIIPETNAIPKLTTTITTDGGTTPITVTTFEWQPPVQNPPPSTLSLTFDPGASLDLNAKLTSGQSPTSEMHGHVGGFKLVFADIVGLNVESMAFQSVTGQKPKIDVRFRNPPVDFLGDLAFVNALRDCIPSTGLSPSSLASLLAAGGIPSGVNGPFLDVSVGGIVAGFALELPNIAIGIFSLENIRLGAALTLPFEPEPVSFEFNFGEVDHKFLLTVDLLAGGGYLIINLDSSGIQRLEFAVEFGANVALNLFIASGSAHILAGASLIAGSDENRLTGYLRAGGELTVLGLVSIAVDFYLGLSDDGGDLYGTASLSVEVSVGFISKSITLTMERRFPGSSADHLRRALAAAPGPPPLADLLLDEDWRSYAEAFA